MLGTSHFWPGNSVQYGPSKIENWRNLVIFVKYLGPEANKDVMDIQTKDMEAHGNMARTHTVRFNIPRKKLTRSTSLVLKEEVGIAKCIPSDKTLEILSIKLLEASVLATSAQ